MTYNHRMERNEDEVHLALLGPVLRGVVGDKIRVVLLNKTPFNVSLYMQGVRFSKDQDGLLEKQGGKLKQPFLLMALPLRFEILTKVP